MANEEQLAILKQGLEISTRGVYSVLIEKVAILPAYGSYVNVFCAMHNYRFKNRIDNHKYFQPVYMKQRILASVILTFTVAACGGRETATIIPTLHDTLGPTFNRITTSSKGFSIDCIPTSITVTSTITDLSGVRRAVLWYRVGSDQPYAQVAMDPISGNDYRAKVTALDLPVGKYGVWEFYIAAADTLGNLSQSPLDTSVELLACVAN